MNKVFKVIWSEARNAYVVVSEIAKNHGSKSCSTKKLLTMLIATGVMTCASMAPAMADNPAAEALKHSTVTAGYNITVTPKDNSDGGKEYNVDLKNDIYLAGDDPDAMVSISGSKGTIWTSSSVTAGSVAVGTAKADGTTPFFVNSNGAFYAADGKLVVDKDGKVTATEGEIGNVVLKNGVLYKNTALRDGELYVGDADGNYSQITTKGAKLGQVTIAADGKIHGVTAGTADTDAVNVSQLKAVGATANMGWNLATNGVATEATNVKPGDFVDFSGDKNISVSHDGTKVQVELNKDIDVNYVQTNALNAKYNLSVGTANENGTALEEKIIKEFEPELGRIRVDRISGEDGDRDKIERVRVNDTKGERDHYGNKLAK